jgi:2'-5' RNA ligase
VKSHQRDWTITGNADDFRPAEVSLGHSSDLSPLRLFLSFNPPPDVISHLNQAQMTLRRVLDSCYGPDLPIRWTRSFQFHVTVVFFGNTSTAKMNSIRTRLIELVGDHPEFPRLIAKGFGCFPAFRRPRVLWIGFASNSSLREWQDRLAKAFPADFGWKERDRSYPHVTVARFAFQRLPSRFGEHLFALAQQIGMPNWDWQIDSISLMRSTPGPKGAEYVVLATLPGPHI